MALNEKSQPARNAKTPNSEQKSKLPSVGAGVKINLPTKNLVWSRLNRNVTSIEKLYLSFRNIGIHF